MGLSLISWNVNGIRSILRKGLSDFILDKSPDILCFQEIKCDDLSIISDAFKPLGYEFFANPAQKKGYSGTLTLWKNSLEVEVLEDSQIGIDEELNNEGRFVVIEIKGIKILNLYVPSGSSSPERQERKYHFMSQFKAHLDGLSKFERDTLLMCGDFNICHKEIDIHHPHEASKKMLSGFLPEEREWFSELLGGGLLGGGRLESGFTDSFRERFPEENVYTWWSYRAGARKKNLGWRIDYVLCGNEVNSKIKEISILTDITGSDHCPLQVTLDI